MYLTITLILIILFFTAFIAGMLGMGGGILSIPLLSILVKMNNDKEISYLKLIAYLSIFALAIGSLIKYIKQKREPI
jgi:uncharacterized membrane protein YfcA